MSELDSVYADLAAAVVRAERADGKVRRAFDLHVRSFPDDGPYSGTCEVCGTGWPCATYAALTGDAS